MSNQPQQPQQLQWNDDVYSRQYDVLPVEKSRREPVTIVGCGHVGSMVALTLFKTGAFTGDNYLTLIDPDKVEKENLSMQFYRKSDVGRLKVEALAEQLLLYGEGNIKTYAEKFDPAKHPTKGIVLSGVDSMAVRKQIFDATETPDCKFFIDARTGGEILNILGINPNSASERKFYMANWVPDESAANDPCTNRGISWTTMRIAGDIGAMFGAYIRGISYPNSAYADMRQWEQFKDKCSTVEDAKGSLPKAAERNIQVLRIAQEVTKPCSKSLMVQF